MFPYSKSSQAKLDTCHPDIQRLFTSLSEDWNISILCGHRNEEDQNKAYESGQSKLKFPQGKHNALPSLAVDAALYPIDWNDTGRHYIFVGMVKQKAKDLGINIRCGADWDSDEITTDQTFNDLVHFELNR